MQMQNYKKNILRPNILPYFSDRTDVDDVFSRCLFGISSLVVQYLFSRCPVLVQSLSSK